PSPACFGAIDPRIHQAATGGPASAVPRPCGNPRAPARGPTPPRVRPRPPNAVTLRRMAGNADQTSGMPKRPQRGPRPSWLALKRVVDAYLALLALIALGPLMLAIALLVRRDS